jgi:Thymidylate kinase
VRAGRPNNRAILISFSGVDGSGKSTSIAFLKSWLENAGMRVRVFEFWNNVVVLRRFREKLTTAFFQGETGVGSPGQPVNRRDKNLRPWYATLGRCVLYLFDAIHLRMVVHRLLSSDVDVVIFDRFIFDQLATLPIEHKAVRAYARVIAKLVPRPDIAYLLDADPEAAFARKPEYPLDFLRQYRQCYLTLKELLGTITLIGPHPLEETQRRLAIEFQKADFSSATQALS